MIERTRNWFMAGALLAILLATVRTSRGDDASSHNPFLVHVSPLLKAHCIRCHGGKEPKGELSLERLRDSWDVQRDYELGQRMLRMLAERQMPPEDEPQPPENEIKLAVGVLEAELAKFDCRGQRHPGRVTIRRLNRVEYNNTVRDLVGLDFQPADDFPSDDVGHGFDNIGDVLSIPPILLEKYLAAAEKIVERASKDEAAWKRILPEQESEAERYQVETVQRNLGAFAARAFRRPATKEELQRLVGLTKFARDRGSSGEEAFKAALVAILASPHFLFRVELDPTPDDPDGIRELSDYELACRLSYFLWSSMPDEELFTFARQGKLRDAATLEGQVQRLLHHPRANALVKNFAGQWLQLRDLGHMTPDPQRYPDFDEPLRLAMLRETEMFFEAVVREDRSVLEFLNADFSFVNERLARHYGITGVKGEEFQRVSLNDQRRGIVTHASVLLLTSNPTRTSPVKRGKWILENILGNPPPPPPPGVAELEEDGELLGSLRERMEQHRTNESCAVCHRQMDTLGFGLENFDGIGAWRVRDGASEIDASGTLPGGRTFHGPRELMKTLADQKGGDFCRCLSEKMLTYALGRGLQSSDRCAVDGIIKQLKDNGYRFSVLIRAIVQSEPFLLREAKQGD